MHQAGIGATANAQGNSLAGNFTAQTHRVFEWLREAMTVFITDSRYGDEFVDIRKQYFRRGFPGSALIGVHALARPGMLVEVQAVVVLDA